MHVVYRCVLGIFVQIIKYNMKLYRKKPDKLIRVNIIQSGDVTRHVVFYDCSLVECFNELMEYVHGSVNGDNKTMLQCREWSGSKNGASMSFSFMGGSLSSIEELIVSRYE